MNQKISNYRNIDLKNAQKSFFEFFESFYSQFDLVIDNKKYERLV